MVSQLHSLLLFMWWSIATHKIRRTHRDFIIIMRCRFAVCIIIIIMQCSFCSLHHHLAMCIVQFASSSMQNAYSLHKHAICTHDKVMHYHRPSMQKIWHITVLMTTIITITITITKHNATDLSYHYTCSKASSVTLVLMGFSLSPKLSGESNSGEIQGGLSGVVGEEAEAERRWPLPYE